MSQNFETRYVPVQSTCKFSQGSCDPAALRLRIPLGYRPSAPRSGTLNKKAEKAFNEKKSRNETTHIQSKSLKCMGSYCINPKMH